MSLLDDHVTTLPGVGVVAVGAGTGSVHPVGCEAV